MHNIFFVFYYTRVLYLLIGETDVSFLCARKNDRFLYDGTRINDDDTPASLEMEDNGTVPSPLFSHLSAHRSDWLNFVKPYGRHHRRHG